MPKIIVTIIPSLKKKLIIQRDTHYKKNSNKLTLITSLNMDDDSINSLRDD